MSDRISEWLNHSINRLSISVIENIISVLENITLLFMYVMLAEMGHEIF